MRRLTLILQGITMLLLFLWIPVSIHKLLEFDAFSLSISRQPIPPFTSKITIYTIPILEILTCLLLITSKFRLWGFRLSTLLMGIFSGYIALALLDTWENLPCACGLIISNLGWSEHLLFNIALLIISLTGWILQSKHLKNIKDISPIDTTYN